jgi:hypothetical protein
VFIDNQWIIKNFFHCFFLSVWQICCTFAENFKFINVMKKTLFSLTLCLLGLCGAYAVSLPGISIVFVEIYGIMPVNDPHNGDAGGRPDPTQQIIGGIDGNDLNIGIVGDGEIDAGEIGEVIVIDPETGEIIIEEEIIGQTSVNIPEPGSYTAYVVVDGITYAGDFVVE